MTVFHTQVSSLVANDNLTPLARWCEARKPSIGSPGCGTHGKADQAWKTCSSPPDS